LISWGRGVEGHSDLNRPLNSELFSCSCLSGGQRGAGSPHGGAGEGKTRGPLPRRGSGGRPPRKRHPDWLRAQKFVTRFVESLEDIAKYEDELVRCASDYLEDVEDKVIVLHHIEAEMIKVLPYRTRFDPNYGDEVLNKLFQLKMALSMVRARSTFLTLTFDPKRLTSLYDYKHVFGINLSRLMLNIKRKYGYRYFICVLELQKNGNLHAHILLIGVPYIPLKWLKKQLKALGFGSEHIKELRGSAMDAIGYGLKYFKKALVNDSLVYNDGSDDVDQRIFRLKALLWALNLRQIRLSESCLEVLRWGNIRLTHPSMWIFVGTYYKYQFPKLGIITDPNIIFEVLSKPPPKC
jgi:hypothetical protein